MKLPGLQEGAGGGIVDRDGHYVREETVQVLGDVVLERRRQADKWGEQNHGATVWLTVLTEEVGELAEAILEERAISRVRVSEDQRQQMDTGVLQPIEEWSIPRIRAEAVQCAAVAVAMIEWIDRGLPIDGTDADYRGPR